MNVLFATSEATPFAKTGGLGDVAGTLPKQLKEAGIDIRVIMPLYSCIPDEFKEKMVYINHIYIDMAWRKQYCGIYKLEHDECTFYFIDNKFYFGGNSPYSYIHEDVEKFSFFSKAALSVLPTLDFRPDIIHCNDWQTGAIPVYLDVFQDNPFYQNIKSIMTIHNLKFQGRWGLCETKDILGINDSYFTDDKLEYYTDANLLKGGLVYSDKITTVSESYAKEITTLEYGEGLDGLLFARCGDLLGILNGISYEEYNPEKDKLIFENYNEESVFDKKKINKIQLQRQLNLPVDENKFVVGIVSRLTDQKGFDLIGEVIEQLCMMDIQIVVLGTGSENIENMLRHFAWKYPDTLSANIYFSNDLAHNIYAGCDAFLMPSKFEPCGLSQIISMKYGTIPIVRETGGLRDTVEPYNEYTGEGTGFSFTAYNSHDMLYVLKYAKDIYQRKDEWNKIIKNAMGADYSWKASADKYIKLYESLVGTLVLPDSEEKTEQAEKGDIPEVMPEQESKKATKTKGKKTTEAKTTKTKKESAKTKSAQKQEKVKDKSKKTKPVKKKSVTDEMVEVGIKGEA